MQLYLEGNIIITILSRKMDPTKKRRCSNNKSWERNISRRRIIRKPEIFQIWFDPDLSKLNE